MNTIQGTAVTLPRTEDVDRHLGLNLDRTGLQPQAGAYVWFHDHRLAKVELRLNDCLRRRRPDELADPIRGLLAPPPDPEIVAAILDQIPEGEGRWCLEIGPDGRAVNVWRPLWMLATFDVLDEHGAIA